MFDTSSGELDELGLPFAEHDHRPARCTTPLRWTAGVQNPNAVASGELGQMAVAVGDRVTIRKPGAESRVPSATLTGVVDEPDSHPLGLEDEALGQLRPERRLVDVAVNSVHRSERTQLGED